MLTLLPLSGGITGFFLFFLFLSLQTFMIISFITEKRNMCLVNPEHGLQGEPLWTCPQPPSHPSRGDRSTSEGRAGPATPHRTQRAHRLPRGGVPLAPAHHAKGAISQLLKEMQVLLPNEAGEALQGPLRCWASGGG